MKRKGFTLLELLVVVVILAILALIAVPAYYSVVNQSKNSVALSNAKIAESELMTELTVSNKKLSDNMISDFVQSINNNENLSPYSTSVNPIPAYTTAPGEKGQVSITNNGNSVTIQVFGQAGVIYTKDLSF